MLLKYNIRTTLMAILLSSSALDVASALRGGGSRKGEGISPASETTVGVEPCTCGNGKAKIWGPGGPHTALIPAAELYNAQRAPGSGEIEICYGPEHTWRDQAMQCASGFMAAAELQAAGLIRVYDDIIDSSQGFGQVATPVTMHEATLLVPKGNPKGIQGIEDLIERNDVGLVVVDGAYHDTITSGTGLWEDVVGRTKHMSDTVALRQKICHVASGAGDARNQLLDSENSGCDAWIYWHDWAVANPDIIEEIELPDNLKIYRDLNIIPTTNGGNKAVKEFINFILSSPEVDEAMQEAGWFRDFI